MYVLPGERNYSVEQILAMPFGVTHSPQPLGFRALRERRVKASHHLRELLPLHLSWSTLLPACPGVIVLEVVPVDE